MKISSRFRIMEEYARNEEKNQYGASVKRCS